MKDTESLLLEDNNKYYYKPWFKYIDSIDLSDNLKIGKKGHIGEFSKSQMERYVKKAIKFHMENDVHIWIWCQDKFDKDLHEQKVIESMNLEAGIKIHNNVLYCLKKGLSSIDFIDLNSKEASSTTATKNDSRNEYFILRNIYHRSLCEKVHQMFEKVK